jgi:hypothetical protein
MLILKRIWKKNVKTPTDLRSLLFFYALLLAQTSLAREVWRISSLRSLIRRFGGDKTEKNLLSAVCSFEPHQPRRSKPRSAMTLKTAFASSFFCLTFSSGLIRFAH